METTVTLPIALALLWIGFFIGMFSALFFKKTKSTK